MDWRVRTVRDVWVFTAVISIVVIIGSIALRYLLLPAELAAETVVVGAVITLVLVGPIAWVVGRRMRAVHLLSEQLEHAINHDPLTGVHTRSSFYARTGSVVPAQRAVIVADIDNFKGFNDRHGHFAGDQALRQFASILARNCRGTDIVARFGGEEFVIVLHDAGEAEGLLVAERLVARIRSMPIKVGSERLTLSASFGVAALASDGDMDRAIQNADRALYRAKEAGRDRACVFDPAQDTAAVPRSTAAE
jgi:diguanylate cyclase